MAGVYYHRTERVNKLGFKELLPVLQAEGIVRISITDNAAFLWDTGQDFSSVQIPSGVANKGNRRYRILIYEGDDVISGYCDLDTAAEALGADVAVNGAFAADTNWTKGTNWTIADGVAAKATETASILKPAVQLTFTKGLLYKIVFDIKSVTTAGTLQLKVGTKVLGSYTAAADGIVAYVTGTGEALDVSFSADATWAGTIDNVVIKSVTDAPDKQGIDIYNAEAGGANSIIGGIATLPANFDLTGTITYKVIPLF